MWSQGATTNSNFIVNGWWLYHKHYFTPCKTSKREPALFSGIHSLITWLPGTRQNKLRNGARFGSSCTPNIQLSSSVITWCTHPLWEFQVTMAYGGVETLLWTLAKIDCAQTSGSFTFECCTKLALYSPLHLTLEWATTLAWLFQIKKGESSGIIYRTKTKRFAFLWKFYACGLTARIQLLCWWRVLLFEEVVKK